MRKCPEANSRCVNFNFNRKYILSCRCCRERCALLTNRQVVKEESELKQSGISPEDTRLENEIRNIIDRMRECDEEQENQDNENIQENKKERKVAEDMRLTAMKNLEESKA